MGRIKTGVPAIEKAQRQEKALQLRLAGATIRAIAEKLGISKSTAQRDVADAIAEIKREPAQQVIDMELQRLDAMLLGVWKDAITGDPKAIAATLKIMERRAKYQNLDSAVAPDTSGEGKAALSDLMGAIRASVVDHAAVAASAVAPGAVPLTVGIIPDNDEDQP